MVGPVARDAKVEFRFVELTLDDKPRESVVGNAVVSGGNVVVLPCSRYEPLCGWPPVGLGLNDSP